MKINVTLARRLLVVAFLIEGEGNLRNQIRIQQKLASPVPDKSVPPDSPTFMDWVLRFGKAFRQVYNNFRDYQEKIDSGEDSLEFLDQLDKAIKLWLRRHPEDRGQLI